MKDEQGDPPKMGSKKSDEGQGGLIYRFFYRHFIKIKQKKLTPQSPIVENSSES